MMRRQRQPLFTHDRVTIHYGDCLEVMARMPEASVDSIVTDPPYGLGFMGKAWDQYKTGRAMKYKDFGEVNTSSIKEQSGKGGAGPQYRKKLARRCIKCGRQAWSGSPCKCEQPQWEVDNSDLNAFQSWCAVWARAALRVAKPGATLLAFGGTRTFHRLAVAVEDAGWELRDTLMYLYGAGFPKSLNISKAIDKIAGAERELIGKYRIPDDSDAGNAGKIPRSVTQNGGCFGSTAGKEGTDITAPATPAAKLWDGWGTALKPAWEPIIVAMKPLDGTFAGNAVKHGVAGLWIDGGRVSINSAERDVVDGRSGAGRGGANGGGIFPFAGRDEGTFKSHAGGRWPANLVLSHDPRCVQVGVAQDPGYHINRFPDGAKPFGGGAGHEYESEAVPGGEVEVWACVPGCPVRILDGQSGQGSEKSRKLKRHGKRAGEGWGLLAESVGVVHGDSGGASRFFYTAKASSSERILGCPPGFRNAHPTVKPISLCRYLCRLTRTPTGGVVLDPFSGSGSIAVAALLEGRTAIAIELERESAECTVGRVQAALKWGSKLPNLRKFKLKGRPNMKRRRT